MKTMNDNQGLLTYLPFVSRKRVKLRYLRLLMQIKYSNHNGLLITSYINLKSSQDLLQLLQRFDSRNGLILLDTHPTRVNLKRFYIRDYNDKVFTFTMKYLDLYRDICYGFERVINIQDYFKLGDSANKYLQPTQVEE